MEVTVVNTGGLDPIQMYDLSKGLLQDPGVMNYIQYNYDQFMQMSTNIGSQLVDTVKNIYNYFTNNEVVNRALSVIQSGSSIISDDIIQLVDMSRIQDMGLVNRQYVMADPYWFNMYKKNRCSGWDGIWPQAEMSLPPEIRDDYLHSIDGLLQFKDDGAEVLFPVLENENPLKVTDRVIISMVKDRMFKLAGAGLDPTDPKRGKL